MKPSERVGVVTRKRVLNCLTISLLRIWNKVTREVTSIKVWGMALATFFFTRATDCPYKLTGAQWIAALSILAAYREYAETRFRTLGGNNDDLS